MSGLSTESGEPEAAHRRIAPDTLAAVVALAAFGVITLGPALLGLRVFAGLDLLGQVLPYSRVSPLDEPVLSIFVRDTVDNLLPAYAEFRSRLLAGDIASWLPSVGGGAPLAALPAYGLFSPLAVPYWLLPTWLAPAFVQLLTLGLAVGGMFAFLRRLACRPGPALVGGLIFATSGFMVAWTNWQHPRVGAFIPVFFWALERFVQVRTARSAVPIGLAVAGLVLGGFPAVAGLTLYAGAAYLAVRLLADRERHGIRASVRSALVAGAAVALGLGMTAVQLLPLGAYLGTLDLSYREAAFATTPAKYAATAAFPQAFFANQYGPGTPFSRALNPVEINMHLGSVALVLVVVAVLGPRAVRRPRGATTFLVLAAVTALWLIFVQGPLVNWLEAIPVFADNPIGRVRSILGFAAAAVAGIGFDAVLRARSGRTVRDRWLQWGVPVTVVGLLVAGYLVDRAQTPLLGGQVRRDVVLAGLAALVAGALILTALRWRPARRAAAILVPLLVAAQGVQAVQDFWPTSSREEFYPVTAGHEFLAAQADGYRVAQTAATLFPNSTAVYDINLLGGHSFFAPSWADLLTEIAPGTFVAPTLSTLDPGRPELASAPGLDRLAVRYYVSGDGAPIPGRPVRVGETTGTVTAREGEPLRRLIDPEDLRGIGVPVAGGAIPAGSRLSVSIVDASGAPVVSGSRPLPALAGPVGVYLPLAGEGRADRPGPWQVEVTLTGSDHVEVAGADGQPQLILVTPADDGLRLVEVEDGLTIWERRNALPRLRWAARSQVVDDPAQRRRLVAASELPVDTVVLSAPAEPLDGAGATLEVLEDSGDTIRVRVRADGAGYLVVADAIQDAWSARVDGTPVDIVDADHALGAVRVGAGEHEVVLRYSPNGRAVGAWVSLGSAAVLLAALVPFPWWRRRDGDQPTGLRATAM